MSLFLSQQTTEGDSARLLPSISVGGRGCCRYKCTERKKRGVYRKREKACVSWEGERNLPCECESVFCGGAFRIPGGRYLRLAAALTNGRRRGRRRRRAFLAFARVSRSRPAPVPCADSQPTLPRDSHRHTHAQTEKERDFLGFLGGKVGRMPSLGEGGTENILTLREYGKYSYPTS